jgi:uncharacterized protein YabE (DUF348 family)
MQKKLQRLQREYALAHRRNVRMAKRHAKKPVFAIPALTFLSLLVVVIVVWLVYSGGKPQLQPDDDTNIVMLSYDKQEQTVPTRAKTVGALLNRLDIKLHDGDVVEPTMNTDIRGDNFRVNVYRAVPVTIVDGADKTFTYSAAATARSIVKQAGMTVYPEDRLQIQPTENFVTESSIGERVVINRATPVNVNLYGTAVAMRTHATTVRDLMKEKNIRLGKDDTVQPGLDTKLSTNGQIFLVRKGMQIATQEVPIDMPIETVEDKSLSFGTQVVRQQGAPGKKLVTFQIELQNGVEIGRKVIQEVVAQEPVKQVVAKGVYFDIANNKTAVMAAAGLKPGDYRYADYIISRESGWCHTKWQGEYGGCPSYHGTPTSSKTGYGLCQATPANKMATAGADWGSNPVTQMKWCHNYAVGRYGTWAAAYDHWTTKHWW